MENSEIEKNILDAVGYLKDKISRPFYICGSYCMYLHGKELGREFHDFDVLVPGLSKNEMAELSKSIDFRIPIHIIPCEIKGTEYEDIFLEGVSVPTITIESWILAKKRKIEKIRSCRFMPEPRQRNLEKHLSDLQYMKDHYGIE